MTTTTKRKPAAKKAGAKKKTTAKKKSAKKKATPKKKAAKKAAKKATSKKRSSTKKPAAKKAAAKKGASKKSRAKKATAKKKPEASEIVDFQPSLIHEALDAAWPSTMAELSVQPNATEEPSFETLVGMHSSDPEAAVVVVRPTHPERQPGLLTRLCHRVLEFFGGRWPER